ncbi:MAG: hypothetical protein R6W90_01940, partial [Ignavibacteriaceae bacterium]
MDLLANYEQLKKDFPSWSSLAWLIVSVVILCGLLEPLLVSLGLIVEIRIVVYSIIFTTIIGLWIIGRRFLPRNKKGKIGIVVGIKAENDKQKAMLKNDFIQRLKELVQVNNPNNYIEVIVLNEFQQSRVNKILFYNLQEIKNFKENPDSDIDLQKSKKSWEKIRNRINGHFWIRGLVKERKDIENTYFLNLDASVSHSPIDIQKQNPIEGVFKEIWFHKISFREKFELRGFTFTADLVFLAVKYVTGTAALMSRDPFTAFKLHENLTSDLNKFKPLPENLQKVCERTKYWLEEESILICRYYMEKGDWKNFEDYLTKVFQYNPNSYDGYLLKSVYDFSFKKNIPDALSS